MKVPRPWKLDFAKFERGKRKFEAPVRDATDQSENAGSCASAGKNPIDKETE